jgi:hypothetical protein
LSALMAAKVVMVGTVAELVQAVVEVKVATAAE